MQIALATCSKLPEPDADEDLLVRALEAAGLRVRLLPWDAREAGAADPAPGELVVLRSTWNYYADVDRFLAWVDRAASITTVLNPPPIVRRNARKTYLRDLEQRGVAIVPTEVALRGESRDLGTLVRDRAWPAFVIKPVVSAGSFLTRRFETSSIAAGQRFLEELTAQRDAMIQRWMPAVDTYGERALVWVDGTLTHAVRKSPRFDHQEENVSEAVPIREDERRFAESILAPLRSELLYARVDIIEDDGVLRLMELELIEPSLFLRQSPRALARLVQAITRRAG